MSKKNGTTQVDYQLAMEELYSKRNIRKMLEKDLRNSEEIRKRIEKAAELVTKWLSKTYYESKQRRLEPLKKLDPVELVLDLLVTILPLTDPELLTSVVGRFGSFNYSMKTDGVTTVAELIAVVADVDLYDVMKDDEGMLYVKSNIVFDNHILEAIEQTQYLPPMVCTPLPLTNNYDSGYLTVRSHLVLGGDNNHDGDLCLSYLNKVNSIPLSLDVEFLTRLSETPNKDLITPEKEAAFTKMAKDSYRMYTNLVRQGNKFYLTNRPDKRGRIYTQGYHVNAQGTSFKKAMIEFHRKEVVTGVPNKYRK
jgi:hypothetical protein